MAVDTARLTIGPVTMSGSHLDPVVDAYGCEWLLTKLDGWDDGWSARSGGSDDSRTADHGVYADEVWAGPRVVIAEGRVKTPSWDTATLAFERLMGAVPLSDLTTMTVAHGVTGVLPTKQAAVRQGGDPRITVRNSGYLGFSLSLMAPDPRRYSTLLSSVSTGLPNTTGGETFPVTFPVVIGATVTSGQVTATNEGNVDTPPTLTITGPCPPCAVTHLGTNQRLAVVDAIDAGRTLTLDTVNRVARLDGTTDRTVTGSWFHLAPGPNPIGFSAISYDPAALLTINYRSAWK